MLRITLLALSLSLLAMTTACLQSAGSEALDPRAEAPPEDTPPEDTPPEDTPPEDTPPEDTPPEDTPPEDTPPEEEPPEDTLPEDTPPGELSPRLVLEEKVGLSHFKHPIYPSLAVDDAGRPHFYVTLWRDQRDSAGYLMREADGWRHFEVVSGPSAGIGYGGGLTYGFVDWTAQHGLEAWIWRDADGATALDNRTDVFRRAQGAWQIVDSIDDSEAYQALRDDGGRVVAAMGHYGGNNYVVQPSAEGWHAEFLPAYSNRPLAVLTPEGTVAALSRLQLVHSDGSSEAIVHSTGDSEFPPFGPVVTSDGAIHVLRRGTAHGGNRITLSTRAAPGSWNHELLAADPYLPPAEECPPQIGAPCVHHIERIFAVGIVSAQDQVIPLTLRQPHQVEYQRECLQYDPNWCGSTAGPCLEENGPTGPWLPQPSLTPSGATVLEVAGVEVALLEPFAREVRAALTVDTDGFLHVAYLEQDAFRYLLIDLYAR